MMFKRATKQQAKLRLALVGPSGSGKTYTALKMASELGQRIAVIDTEHGSASKYADLFTFDVCELDDYHPERYVEAMRYVYKQNYDVLVIDSISHAWEAVLDLVNQETKRSKSGNSYVAWSVGTPIQNNFIKAMLMHRSHIIATMRSKTEYIIEANDRGKQQPRKVGMAPVQRSGVEYEFDVVGELDYEHTLSITKTRCPVLDRLIAPHADGVMDTLSAWLTDGAPVPDVVSVVDTETGEIIEHPGLPDNDRNKLLVARLKALRVAEQDAGLDQTPMPAELSGIPVAKMDTALLAVSIATCWQHLQDALTNSWMQELEQATEIGGDAPDLVTREQEADNPGESNDPSAFVRAIIRSRERLQARGQVVELQGA